MSEQDCEVAIIGAGEMAIAYAKVLQRLKRSFCVIGRGARSGEKFARRIGKEPMMGGVDKAFGEIKTIPPRAIVAVNAENLSEVSNTLIRMGVKDLLVEKPSALSTLQAEVTAEIAEAHGSRVWVAYNRRFYASCEKARSIIEADGGARSLLMDFSERSLEPESLGLSDDVKAKWVISNSSHVLDLGFHLCGEPTEWSAQKAGALSWHPTAGRFIGSGMTDRNVFFSYSSDWEFRGNWGVEVVTKKHRVILRPLEKLYSVEEGSSEIRPVPLDDELDRNYKPGLYKQVSAFLSDRTESMCSIYDQVRYLAYYSKIAGYET